MTTRRPLPAGIVEQLVTGAGDLSIQPHDAVRLTAVEPGGKVGRLPLRNSTVHAQRLCLSLSLVSITFASGCAGPTQVTSIDLTERQGVYVVAYVDDERVRASLERQLAEDLAGHGIESYPSIEDIADIIASTADGVLSAADQHRAAALLVLNPVNRDGSGSVVVDPRRISPVHPDLQAMYQYSRRHAEVVYDPEREAILEVNLFAVSGGSRGELFWSGTAWSFEADGTGAAVRDLSGQIAGEMAKARQRLLGSESGPASG